METVDAEVCCKILTLLIVEVGFKVYEVFLLSDEGIDFSHFCVPVFIAWRTERGVDVYRMNRHECEENRA